MQTELYLDNVVWKAITSVYDSFAVVEEVAFIEEILE